MKISILITTYNTDPKVLHECIESARHQAYENIEICIADDASERVDTLRVVQLAEIDPRVKVVFRPQNGHIAAATNSAFSLATGDWIAILDHDDLLHPLAIDHVVRAIKSNPTAQLIYSDEDKVDSRGRRYAPFFKPDFSLELLRSQNYINHLAVYRAETVRRLGGWRVGFEGSQDYDLNLRMVEQVESSEIIHVPEVLYHWRATKGSTALSSCEKSYAYDAGKRALEEHAFRLNIAVDIDGVPGTGYYRFASRLPVSPPLVTIIVNSCSCDQTTFRYLSRLVGSTSYNTIEIMVVKEWQGCTSELSVDREFAPIVLVTGEGLASVHNRAAKLAKGEFLCFLEFGVQPLSEFWLAELTATALQTDVGCVGAKLCYSGQTIHNAGIVLGVRGTVGFSYQNHRRKSSGYFARLKLSHNVAAASSSCMLTRKRNFLAAGGFNETISFGVLNDVDLALRMSGAQLRHVMDPAVEMTIAGEPCGGSQAAHKNDAFVNEYTALAAEWGGKLRKDPYYSPNHALRAADFLMVDS